MIGILDFAATCAGKVTTEEGFEHEDKGIAFVATDFVREHKRQLSKLG